MADDCNARGRGAGAGIGPAGGGRRRVVGLLRRLVADRRAIQAVEFALVGPVVLVLMCTILELGVLLLEEALLDNGTATAARMIQTLQITATNEATFQSTVCAALNTMVDTTTCTANLEIRVQSASTFGAINGTITTNASGTMTNTAFAPGSAGSDVLVQVGYSYAFVIPWVGQFLGHNGNLLLLSTAAFQNEL